MFLRKAYTKGFIDCLHCFTWWKDGIQYVGGGGMQLGVAIKRVETLWNFSPPEELLPTLNRIETDKFMNNMVRFGTGIIQNGKSIEPKDFYFEPKNEAEVIRKEKVDDLLESLFCKYGSLDYVPDLSTLICEAFKS